MTHEKEENTAKDQCNDSLAKLSDVKIAKKKKSFFLFLAYSLSLSKLNPHLITYSGNGDDFSITFVMFWSFGRFFGDCFVDFYFLNDY